MTNPNDLFSNLNPNLLYINRQSYKSFLSENNKLCAHTLSTSAQFTLNQELSKRELSKDSNFSSNSYSESNSHNNENELDQVKTIIVNGNLSDDEEENKNIPIGNLNETSSFIPITGTNDCSMKSNTNSHSNSKIGTDKITFKNIICDNSNDTISKNSSLYSLKSPFISKQSSNQSFKKNKTEIFSFKNNSFFSKENNNSILRNSKHNIFENLTSQNINNDSIQQLEKNKNDDLLNTIPYVSKKILLSKYYDYLKSNIPIVYSKNTDNKIINGFSAFTYKNDSMKVKTKISININLNNSHGIFNFFSLYNPIIDVETIDNKYQQLINNNITNYRKFLNDISGEILILTFHNNIFFISHHEIYNNNNQFQYKAFYSIDNVKKIYYLNIEQKIRIQKNFDFLILFNKGVFNFLSNKEISEIIYKTMKKIILENESYALFLEKVVKNIFKNVIKKGGKKDMACIFLCFPNLKNIFEKRNINKIDKALIIIENMSYNNEDHYNPINKNEMSLDSLKLIIPSNKIGINKSNNNISFEKSINSNIEQPLNQPTKILDNNINKKKIQKKTLLSCCGIFC